MIFIAALFGLLLGSFFNVLICRLPENKSIVFPASHCPQCKTPLKPWHNIPVLSYLLLRGKCHSCKKRISPMYPIIELLTGMAAAGLWVLISGRLELSTTAILTASVTSVFLLLIIPIAVIDFKHYIIPDELTFSFLLIGSLISFLPGSLTPQQALLGIAAGGGTLFIIGWVGELLLKKEAMGGGDIKYMAAAGALFGPKAMLLAIIFGSCLGALYGVIVIVSRKRQSTHQIPFGPFLATGVFIAVFFGQTILDTYMETIGALIVGF